METTNEIMNEVAEVIETNAMDDVADAIVANEAIEPKGIGLVEGTLMVATGALVIYGAYRLVKWGVGKAKAVKAAKKAAKHEYVDTEVEAEEVDETVEA